jgi:uncharacterized protein
MSAEPTLTWIAFANAKRIAFGAPREVAAAVKAFVDDNPEATVLVFDGHSSRTVELDLRGSLASVLRRLPAEPSAETAAIADNESSLARGPGRPKLGVVAREVTLLPRHWEWLAAQSGGASVALRKLVEQAARANRDKDRATEARDATYRFMQAMAGDAPGFEEASRALYAADAAGLAARITRWPRDIRAHVLSLAERALNKAEATPTVTSQTGK